MNKDINNTPKDAIWKKIQEASQGQDAPEPRCANCGHINFGPCATVRGKNQGLGAHPCRPCYCGHPKAVETFYKVCPRSPRFPGFIAYTSKNDRLPQIKTSPRWCPLRHQEEEAET